MKQKNNFLKAHTKFQEFLMTKSQSEKEKAGVIQAFEFTFEQAWKFLQKVASASGLEVNSPKSALSAGLQLGAIPLVDEKLWIQMLKDRNLTSHLYHEDLATAVFDRISIQYAPALERFKHWVMSQEM